MRKTIVGLDHVGIAVKKIDEVLPIYGQLLGLKLTKLKTNRKDKVKVAVFTAGETNVELLQPLSKESPISKFLEKRGQGIHHIAFQVDKIKDTLKQLRSKGAVLVDEKPRIGVEGGKIAFLHPKSTGKVLIELCER